MVIAILLLWRYYKLFITIHTNAPLPWRVLNFLCHIFLVLLCLQILHSYHEPSGSHIYVDRGKSIRFRYSDMDFKDTLRYVLLIGSTLAISTCQTDDRCHRQAYYEFPNKSYSGHILVREGPWPIHTCRRFVHEAFFTFLCNYWAK